MENQGIPKIIHYCWFGKGPLSPLAKKCIDSWKKYCPDYKIIEWNEENFDISSNKYTKEAYANKRWAFVTDYVRLYVLHNFGGIYMDTDVEVIKPIDIFLNNSAFSGFERVDAVPTGIMASIKGHQLIKILLGYYNNNSFYRNDGSINTTTNVTIITNMLLGHGLKLNNKKQTINGFTIYPQDYFCPKDFYTGEIECTKNTYTIHHFSGSWKTEEERRKDELKKELIIRYGKPLGSFIFLFPYTIKSIKKHGIFKGIKLVVLQGINKYNKISRE